LPHSFFKECVNTFWQKRYWSLHFYKAGIHSSLHAKNLHAEIPRRSPGTKLYQSGPRAPTGFPVETEALDHAVKMACGQPSCRD